MTATTQPRMTERGPLVPGNVTLPMAANELILHGTIVCRDASGRAVAGVDGEGFPAMGRASGTFDNRTTAPEGGGAGAIMCEAECGVHEWLFTGSTPLAGQVVYVVDNQTVSVDSDSGQRGIAGYVSEVVGTSCYVQMGPTIVGQIVIAASEAAQLDQAQLDIDEAEQDIADIRTDIAKGFLPIPLASFTLAANGAPLVVFSDGAADGLDFLEGQSYRFNPSSTAAIGATVPLPPDLDDAAAIEVHMLVSRVGAADVTAAVTVGAFFQVVGAAPDADADAGGATGAIEQATTVISEESVTIAAGDVPAAPCALSLTLVPTAALDADDLRIHAVWLEFSKTTTETA